MELEKQSVGPSHSGQPGIRLHSSAASFLLHKAPDRAGKNKRAKERTPSGRPRGEGAKPQLCSPGAGLTWPWAVVTGVCLCDCRDGAREERGRREMWKERHPTFRAPLGWRWDVFTQREPQTRMRATAPGPLSRCHSRDEMWSLTPQRAQSGGKQTRGVVGRDDACESTRFG